MNKSSSVSLGEFLLVAGLGIFLLWVSLGAAKWYDAAEKYDWHHGWGASKKVGYEHCVKWCEKHWKDSDRNYKYQLECFLKDPEFYDHKEYSVSTVKAWYKYCYRHGRNTKGWDIDYYLKMKKAGKL